MHQSLIERSTLRNIFTNFAKFTGKHLSERLFFNKVAGLRPAKNISLLVLKKIKILLKHAKPRDFFTLIYKLKGISQIGLFKGNSYPG